jgi:tetratricopeptide (TPR) repeat protein
MANPPAAPLPSPGAEHRQVAAGMFDRANQVVATGNFDYGIRLLLDCCRLDPANLLYRQALRRTEKAKYRNNLRGSWLAWLTAWAARLRLKAALRRGDYLQALEHSERILTRNPWDVGAQRGIAEAAEPLGLLDLAIWALEQARQKQPHSVPLNRALARLYERRGNFTQAMALWQLVAKADPRDTEAGQKLKDLAAQDTIARGQFETALTGEGASDSAIVTGAPGAAAATAPPADRQEGLLGRDAAALSARLEADPTNAELYLQLARLHRRADRLEAAQALLSKGLGPTGNDFTLMVELADLEIEPFRRNLAITEQKLTEAPDDPELRMVRIRLRKEVNTRELDLFRQKADRYPTDLSHRYEVGVRLLRAGQLDEAIRELQAARADPRLCWQALMYIGYCFKARNNWRLAQRNFEEALQHLPVHETVNRKDLLFELAQGHAEAGELARAIDYGHDLANIDFGYRGINQLLDEWQALSGKDRVAK